MAAPVWVLSVDLQTKTATFQTGMADAAKSARGAFGEIKSGATEMGGHIGTNMFASRHAIMAVSEAFGVQVPRAITALLAHIGPVGAALEAAFPFAAIALGAVLLIEAMAKLEEEGHKLTEDQVKFGTTVQNAFNSLDQKMLQAEIRADELRNDHLGALQHQLELIDRASMEELVRTFGEVAKAADIVFGDLQSHWYTFGSGSTGAKRALDDFQTQYDKLLAEGKDKEASDLLKGTRESAEKSLTKLQEVTGKATALKALGNAPMIGPVVSAVSAGTDHGKEQELKAQQTLVDALRAQESVEERIASLKKLEGNNATTSTGKEMSALQAEGARAAAEHKQKMGEISLAADREQAQAMLDVQNATAMQRLLVDMTLADRERDIQLKGNQDLQNALDRGGKDYNNQLQSLRNKAAEIEASHAATISELISKTGVAQNAKTIADLEESEREQIEATQQGSAARLAAIDAAIKEEQAAGLQDSQHFRELQQQRVNVTRQAAEEQAKLTAEAGKEAADNTEKMAQLQIAAQREGWALLASGQRISLEQQLAQEALAANEEFALKQAALQQEQAALDKGGKDYQNKLKELQDKEKQLVQAHENEITAIKDKAEIERNSKIKEAEQKYQDTIASGLTQVLMGQKSFTSMMRSLGTEVESDLLQMAIKHIETNLMTKQSDGAKAARLAYVAGEEAGGPLGFILGPVYAAAAYAGVMAFANGTDAVPGMGNRDTVPAMLTPGEGVVPGGVMDGLRGLVRSGGLNGGGPTHVVHVRPVYNLQALDTAGMERVLDKHSATLAKHVGNEMRKLNR